MNENIERSAQSLPVSRLLEIDKICRQFEAAWKAGKEPRVEDFLVNVPEAQRGELRRELESIDAEYRKPPKPEAYDPYYQWLGIPPKDQPPNHYRLLGVEQFESNLDVIASAAERQTAHLRTFQLGKYSDLSQRLLNEVAKAKVCLLNPAKKAAYDEKLKQQLPLAQAVLLSAPPAPPPPNASPKSQLGEYRLLAKLGSGGMGTVYKARHTKLEKTVALKVLAKGSLVDSEAIARFEREMKAVGQLNHPNIVQAHDAREIGGTRFLVMEYVDGVNLAKLVDACGPLPVADACELVRQTALGLDHAHQHGLVHRDIKPSNLMLDSQGQVKILDLGLAMFQPGQLSGAERITASGQAMGTIDYMAPEQALASRDVDIRADLYSLGCTLYKLLSGHAPFSGPKYQDVVNKLAAHAREPVRPIRKVRADVPAELAAVLDRLLAKDPAARFATPAEVVQVIAPFAAGAKLTPLVARAGALASTIAAPSPIATAASSAHVETLSNLASQSQSITRPRLNLAGWLPPRFHTPGWLAVAAGGGAALVLLTVVILLRKDGKQTRIEVPDGSKVTISAKGDVDVTLPKEEGTEAQRHKGTEGSGKPGSERSGQQAVVSPPLPPGEGRGEGASSTTSPIANPQSPVPPLAIAPFDEKKAKGHQEAWAKHLGVLVEDTNSLGMKLVLIPPGEFEMGATPEEIQWASGEGGKGYNGQPWYFYGVPNEAPRHRVQITKPFYLGMYPVTQAEYETVMGVNPSEFAKDKHEKAQGIDTRRHPVEKVNWDDATDFCRKLSAMPAERAARRVYRLPTEAEWEYACRAGTTTRWWCGDDEAELEAVAWHHGNAGGTTHPVGQKRPNAWRLYDMHGNVWQWCADWFSQDYYRQSSPSDPQGPATGSLRVLRGGSYGHFPSACRAAFRDIFGPATRYSDYGFRVVAEVAGKEQARNQPDAPTTTSTAGDSHAPPPAVAPFDATKAKQHQDAWAKYLGVPVEMTDSIGMKLVLIPPGEFDMGSTHEEVEWASAYGKKYKESQWYFDQVSSESPRHRVKIAKPFYLGKYQVTQEQWEAVMGNNPSMIKAPTNPVENVSWDHCQMFLAKLNAKFGGQGGKFQLPTEAQWEYACRAGSTTRYFFGDDDARLGEYAWYEDNSSQKTHPVGGKKPNAWGLYDMHGSVWKWCADWYDNMYYADSPTDDPAGPAEGSTRVVTGGCWFTHAGTCRSAHRLNLTPETHDHGIGFRVVLVGGGGAPDLTNRASPENVTHGVPDLRDAVQNPSFEETGDDGAPGCWHNKIFSGNPTFAVASVGHSGNRSFSITADEPSCACVGQLVPVRPQTDYRLSAWIRTEGVKTIGNARGANLDVFFVANTPARTGSSDWSLVHVVFNSGKRTALLIRCYFGFGGEATGKAWFDDVRLERLGEPEPTGDAPLTAIVGNPVQLPSSERGRFDIPPPCWHEVVLQGNVTFEKSPLGHSGRQSIAMAASEPSEGQFLQLVNVRPDTDYHLSAWIKTEGVKPIGSAHGAVVGIVDDVVSAARVGTCDWARVETTFNSRGQTAVLVYCQFGYWGAATGKAWFDDVRLEPVGKTLRGATGSMPTRIPDVPGAAGLPRNAAASAPPADDVPSVRLHGLGGQQSLKADEFPPQWRSGSDFARISGDARISFPRVPVSRFVIEIEATFPSATDGKVEFLVWDGHHGTSLSLGHFWDTAPGCRTIPCRLFDKREGMSYWAGDQEFSTGRRLRLSLVGIDSEKALLRDGTPALHLTGTPVDLNLSIVATGSPDCTIHSISIREPDNRDFAAVERRFAVPTYHVAVDPRAAIRIRVQTASLGFRPVVGKAFAITTIGAAMRWAPPGEFVMGGDAKGDEWGKGKHRVKITHGYWIAQYETTQGQWSKLLGDNPSRFRGSPYLPVNSVSWDDARRFCEMLDAAERGRGRIRPGYQYRLPTEAEWEYAARAGEGAVATPTETTAWYRASSGGRPHEVGELPPNRWGLYDMLGNVDEWCLDVWRRYPAGDSPVLEDPFAPRQISDEWLSVRGGAWWMDRAIEATPIARDESQSATGAFHGFRFVLGPTLTE
jgi:formylglycine-generating enzyme required for sulfatase activity/serine/threonine protein kinase